MFKLTKEQQEKYKNQYLQWLKEEDVTIEDFKEFIADYTNIKNTISGFIKDFYFTNFEKTLENLVEYVYNRLRHIIGVLSQQKLDEVKKFGYWDIDFGTITVSFILDNNELKMSNFFNGYPCNSDDIYEDIEINVLEEIVKSCNK